MTITFEQLQLDELKSFLREQANDTFPSLKDEQRLNTLAEKWQTHAEFCTCRDDKGGLVGMIAFYANRPKEKMAYLTHVYVCNEYRNKGVFKKMFYYIAETVHEKGFELIRLEVKKDNLLAQKAYTNIGFHIKEYIDEYSLYMEYNFDKT